MAKSPAYVLAGHKGGGCGQKFFFGGLAKAGQPVFRQGVLNFIFADRAVGVEWESQVIPF